jgi:hypothetical protein
MTGRPPDYWLKQRQGEITTDRLSAAAVKKLTTRPGVSVRGNPTSSAGLVVRVPDPDHRDSLIYYRVTPVWEPA